jgi:DNA-binding transcriptional LysR family regulator
VRLACYATAAPAVLPPILSGVSTAFPDMSITVLEGSIDRVMEFLNKGEADLAFSYGGSTEPRHCFEPLFEAPPFAIVPRTDPLAQKTAISLAELAERPLVMLDLPGARDYFSGVFQAAGVTPRIAHSTRSSEILRALVGIGLGVSMLNIRPLGYHRAQTDYVIVPIKDSIEPPTFGIITISGLEQPRLVKAFIAKCTAMRDRGDFDHLTSG